MARSSNQYVCQSCGAVQARWTGRCESCGSWNSLAEEAGLDAPVPGAKRRRAGGRRRNLETVDLAGTGATPPRLKTGIQEFDRVCGGGLVPGSVILVGGDPGIGKSTILLQAVAALANAKQRTLYVSGEEGVDQVRLRAQRLGVAGASAQLAVGTSVEEIMGTLEAENWDVAVVDSVQTLHVEGLESAPGTVSQVRAASYALINLAKRRNTTLILVGHVTKEGALAGPRVLEHMVDAVLYFEGERGHAFRILRAVKNRFGATDEIGVFEMGEKGLSAVGNPSGLFLAGRETGTSVSGSSIFAGVEGTRPLLVEIQALVGPPAYATPRRAVVGWDPARLSMVLAVLETRCQLELGSRDIYLNVAGGLRITEPAADMAVAGALISSLLDRPLPSDWVLFGEVGLSGEVRPVSQTQARLKEAAKLGFAQAVVPAVGTKADRAEISGIGAHRIDRLQHLVDLVREQKPAMKSTPRPQQLAAG